MADSEFIKAFNFGHAAFRSSKGEIFTVVSRAGQVISRDILAIEIAELTAKEVTAAGGKYADNTVMLEVFKSDRQGLVDGDKVIVRGKRLRIDGVVDSGDNKVTLIAAPAGVKL